MKAIHDFRHRTSIRLAVVASALDRVSMKKLFAIFFAFWAFFYANVSWSADVAPSGNVWTKGVPIAGKEIWYGPSFQTGQLDARMVPNTRLITNAAGGGATLAASYKLPFAAGEAVVLAKGFASGAAIFAAAKAIMGGPVGVGLTAMMLVPALVDWFTTDTSRPAPVPMWSTGTPFEKMNGGSCTDVSPCYLYSTIYFPDYLASPQNVCDHLIPSKMPGGVGYGVIVAPTPTDVMCKLYKMDGTFWVQYGVDAIRQPNTIVDWTPASVDDIKPIMDVENSIPGSVNGLLGVGGSLPISYAPGGDWTTTPPASVSGPQVVSVTNDGTNTTTTTTTPKTDLTYGTGPHPVTGSTVGTVTGSTSSVTVTNVVNNTTGATTTTTNITNTVAKTAEPTPVEDPCDKNPDRVGCLNIDTPTGEIPKESKTITYTPDTMFGSGSCPANLTASLGTLGKTVTVWDWQKTCEYSLPLRALIMALAGFAAFLIVMPVKVDV